MLCYSEIMVLYGLNGLMHLITKVHAIKRLTTFHLPTPNTQQFSLVF